MNYWEFQRVISEALPWWLPFVFVIGVALALLAWKGRL